MGASAARSPTSPPQQDAFFGDSHPRRDQSAQYSKIIFEPATLHATSSPFFDRRDIAFMHSVSELARQLHNEAVGLARMGRNREACEKLRSAIKASGETEVDPRTLKALWQIARADGDWPTALAAGIRASVRDPLDFPFTDKLVRSLHECPIAALVANSAYPFREMPAQPRTLSVIIVSQNDQRYAEVDAQYEKAFAAWAHERIRISDATSMYDGYARGFEKSGGEIVVFSHDDIRFAVPDFAARLAETMSEADIVGVA